MSEYSLNDLSNATDTRTQMAVVQAICISLDLLIS